MPAGLIDNFGIDTPFAYVTVPQVREAGIKNKTDDPEFGVDDAPLRGLIRTMSHWINRLTTQWFLPVRLKQPVDGARGSIARMPNQIPILDLFRLRLEREGLISFDYPTIAFQVKNRYVMMVTRHVRLPEYPHFVVLDGVFGWQQNAFTPVRTTLSVALDPVAGEAKVVDATKFRPGDAVLVGSEPEPKALHFIVEEVDTSGSPHVLRYDPELTFRDPEVPAGTRVARYGQVPDLIQRACLLMIRDRIVRVGELDTAEDPFGIGTRLNSESVEGYSYSLGATPAQHGHAGGSWTTGNVEVDDYLQEYSMPNMYIGLA